MSIIYEDTRQQAGKHRAKHAWWLEHGIEVVRKKLDFGDYMADGSNYSIDTKRNVAEIAQNINGREHARFKRECQRAADAGCRLVVLVENTEGYRSVADVRRWTNDHCLRCQVRRDGKCKPRDVRGKCLKHGTRKPVQGPRLARAMSTMQERYGVRFEFCAPGDAARIVCERLGVDYGDDA
jgi:ribosome-associated protein